MENQKEEREFDLRELESSAREWSIWARLQHWRTATMQEWGERDRERRWQESCDRREGDRIEGGRDQDWCEKTQNGDDASPSTTPEKDSLQRHCFGFLNFFPCKRYVYLGVFDFVRVSFLLLGSPLNWFVEIAWGPSWEFRWGMLLVKNLKIMIWCMSWQNY